MSQVHSILREKTRADLIGMNHESHRMIWHEIVHGERCAQVQASQIHMSEVSHELIP